MNRRHRIFRILEALSLGVISIVLVFVSAASGEEIDRLLAAVNGKVITGGDILLARSLNVVIFSGSKESLDSDDQALSRLIDLELLRQELKNFGMAKEDESEVESRLQALRDAYVKTGGLTAFLQKHGLQESELIAYLRLESSILRFVNFRFRPFINVTNEEINSYYEKRLAPQLEKSKLDLPPLSQVSTRIEEILREEKINEVFDQWIATIRHNSRIEYFEEKLRPSTEVGKPQAGSRMEQ
jgi:hypothetical protein